MKKILILFLLIFLVGCTTEVLEENEEIGSGTGFGAAENEKMDYTYKVKVETNKGDFVIGLYW